ncbi:MAG: CvpA family protein [Hyphomicrobiaceae bacterium]
MIGPLSFLDAALIAVALLSGLLAMYRGLTRELLAILSWVLAGAAVLYIVLYQKAFAEDVGRQIGLETQIAQILIGAIVFLLVLVVVHLITARLSDSILDSRIGMFDRMFGFLFGVARGFVLVVIPVLFYEKLYPTPASQPEWVRESLSMPALRSTGQAFEGLLLDLLPSELSLPDQQQGHLIETQYQALFRLCDRRLQLSVTLKAGARVST